MRIHREGYPTLMLVSVVLALINWMMWGTKPFRYIFLLSIVVFGFFARFFRDPPRHTPDIPDVVFSPADGTIVDIQVVHEPEYFEEERLKISIYMSALNVHLNRVPLTGRVNYVKYHPGEYLVAFHPKASELNERSTMVFVDDDGREIMVRQIAGLLARRIVTYMKAGQDVQAGGELGFIKFGSRCDVFLPTSATALVKLEQRVTGGETAIARL